MRRVVSLIIITLVALTALTTVSFSIPAKAAPISGAQTLRQYTLQSTKLHGLNIPPGVSKDLKVQAVVVIKPSTPLSKVMRLYNSLKKVTITMLGRKFSIVASMLRRDSRGDYIFKVIGPIGKIVSTLRPYRSIVLGLAEKPLINFETALLYKAPPRNKEFLITDSLRTPDISKIKPKTSNFFIRYLIGAADVEALYGLNGSGIKVAVVDTGVDYGNPDLQGALAYYVGTYNGTKIREPLVLDADENLVILFKTFTANATGFINVSGVYFNDYIPYPVDIVAPYDVYNVSSVTSASGNYRFGVLLEYMAGQGGWIKVGVLLTDPITPGNYTTLYVDANNDSIFGDPGDIKVTYDGNRILAAYKPGSSWPYASFGVAGGFFFDAYWIFNYPGQIYAGWDLKGRYLSVFYDFYGHGTSCAAAIASRGFPEGIAPGAKIVGIKGLWIGDVEVGMLWAAGFNISGYTPVYTGTPRVDLISNSWGISNFIYDISGFGYDFESLFEDAITTPGFLNPNYPGVLIVHAAGNGGAGYGTITSPGAAGGVLTVGASTSTHLYYYFWGFGGYTYDDIVSWSARGPTPAGYIKPDVVNVGAWGLTAAPVWLSAGNYTIFGGTSYATPLTAGVAALVYQALKSQGMTNIPPWLVKQIIMNTAVNLHYPPFDEGAGRVNALAAVQLALKIANPSLNTYKGLRIYSNSFYRNTAYKMARIWEWMWLDYFNYYSSQWYGFTLPPISPYSLLSSYAQGKAYSIYEPDISQGGLRYFTFTVENPTSSSAVVQASVVRPAKIAGPINYYLRFTIPAGSFGTYKYIVIPPSAIPKNTEYLTADVVLPYSVFDGDNDYKADYYVIIIAYVWIGDFNGNGIPDTNERVVINFGYSLSNHNLVQVKLPLQLLKEYGPNAKLLLRVWLVRGDDPTPARASLRNQIVKVGVTYYGFKPDNWVRILSRYPGGKFFIRAGSAVTIKGIIRPPVYVAPTAYQDYVRLNVRFADGTTMTYYVPLSYTVYTTLRAGWSRIVNTGPGAASYPYSWSFLKGDTAWDWRYESGDWRVFYVNIPDPRVWLLQLQVSWFNSYTSLITYTLGPDGQFAGTYYGAGASFHRYLGSGRFLWVDTGRYKSPNTRSVITFPLTTYRDGEYPTPKPNVGVYTIIVRTALYGGSYYFEGFRVWVRALPGYKMLPNTVMPTNGQLSTYVRLPYRANFIYFAFWQALLPASSSQYLCYYDTLRVTPSEYTRPSTFYRYTLEWSGLNCYVSFEKPRVDLIVLYLASFPEIPVYYKYSNHYNVWTDYYVLQDWMITGNLYYTAPSGD